jgi:aryl-alcohol dehydrogenase-like predicted oxidoreductase
LPFLLLLFREKAGAIFSANLLLRLEGCKIGFKALQSLLCFFYRCMQSCRQHRGGYNYHGRTNIIIGGEMQFRELGRTGCKVSTISFGAWAIGNDWGTVDDQQSLTALHRALDLGVNFFDTADVYGDGRSERLLARLRRERKETFYIATKAGRRLNPHAAAGYNRENLTAFVERSLDNLATEALDLLQLHCPPTEVFYMPEVFEALDDLVRAGKVRYYGVSVEKVEEALKAIEYPGVQTVQIIFNIFRQRPADLFFAEAQRRQVGILARLPLSSGMLAGKFSKASSFEASDHRSYNRHGESFDRGETFSGLDFDLGLQAVEALRSLVPSGMSMAQLALRWILMFPAVTCAIPGAKRPEQVEENVKAADLPPVPETIMSVIQRIYDHSVRPQVHHYW